METERCTWCQQPIVEQDGSDYAQGYTYWTAVHDLPEYHPCEDDEGRIVPHSPSYEAEPDPDRRDLWERRIP